MFVSLTWFSLQANSCYSRRNFSIWSVGEEVTRNEKLYDEYRVLEIYKRQYFTRIFVRLKDTFTLLFDYINQFFYGTRRSEDNVGVRINIFRHLFFGSTVGRKGEGITISNDFHISICIYTYIIGLCIGVLVFC